MTLFQEINNGFSEIIFGLIIGLFISALVLYYLIKIHKVKSVEETFNYGKFQREDTLSYVNVDDIVYSTNNTDIFHGMGMIVNDHNRFTAGIEIYGNGFYNLEGKKQAKVIVAIVAFIKMLKSNVQFGGASKKIDETEKIKIYKLREKEIVKELMTMDEDKKELIELARENVDDDERYNMLISELDKLKKMHYVKEEDLKEVRAIIEYLEQITSSENYIDPERVMYFTYEYDEDAFIEKKSKEEIYLFAYKKLSTQAEAYCDALAAAGCYALPMAAGKLFGAFLKQFHPKTIKNIPLKEWFGKSTSSLLISSDSLVERYIEINSEEQWKRELEQYQKELDDSKEKNRTERINMMNEVENEMEKNFIR